ncbi:MAG: porin [Acetobacteraceae bacterium]|nr:porin [Acetobacteraceae bacterium]
MRKILLGTTAVVGLALVAPVANAQQARPAARPAAAPAAPPALPATSVAPTGTAAALFQTPVGITGAGPHGADGIPNRPTTPTTSGIIVRLGGFFDFSMGNVQDEADKGQFRNNAGGISTARGRAKNDFRTEAEINLYADGVAANGMRYGAVFELQMDNLAAGSGTGVDYDELYGFVRGSWGELRFGQEDAAANLMQVRRPSVLWMGTDDAWDEFVVQQAGAVFGASPYIMSGLTDGSDKTKIIYLSPQLYGFDFGLSFAPNDGEGERTQRADSAVEFQRDRTRIENEISAILRYRGTFGDVGVAASFGGVWADAPSLNANGAPPVVKGQNVNAYSAGLVLRAYGFQVGGEYTFGNYNGTAPAGAALARGLDGSNHWIGSVVYTVGAFSVGAMYGKGTQDNGTNPAGDNLSDRTQTYLGLGVAYVLAPGMTLFANYNQIEDENLPTGAPSSVPAGGGGTNLANFGSAASPDNTRNITVLVAGVRIAF